MSPMLIECPSCRDGVMLKHLKTTFAPVEVQPSMPVESWYQCPKCDTRYSYLHREHRLAVALADPKSG